MVPNCVVRTEAALALLCPELSADGRTLLIHLAGGDAPVAFGNLTVRFDDAPSGTRFVGSTPADVLLDAEIDRATNRYVDRVDDDGNLRIFMEPANLATPAALGAGHWIDITLTRDEGFEFGSVMTLGLDAWLTSADWDERHVESSDVVEVLR